jgi:hypothetical protein
MDCLCGYRVKGIDFRENNECPFCVFFFFFYRSLNLYIEIFVLFDDLGLIM